MKNTDDMLHYAIEEEIKSPTFLINFDRSLRKVVGIISKGLFLYKRHKNALNYKNVYVVYVAYLD